MNFGGFTFCFQLKWVLVFHRLMVLERIPLVNQDWINFSMNLMILCILSYPETSPTLKTLSVMKTTTGKRIKIIATVCSSWQDLGAQMEFDEFGTKLDAIKAKHSNDPESCCREMFQHWLRGNGIRPCSWRKLIELLQDCDFEHLADQVKSVFTSWLVPIILLYTYKLLYHILHLLLTIS